MALQDQVPEVHLVQLILEILQQVSAYFVTASQSDTTYSYTAFNATNVQSTTIICHFRMCPLHVLA
jgi:hypothetical protein